MAVVFTNEILKFLHNILTLHTTLWVFKYLLEPVYIIVRGHLVCAKSKDSLDGEERR